VRLSRVDIKGFKSIAKKTVLTFPGQVTCICGPNGCGKSNVIDAIRWAIGEQSVRTLRAGNMSDVIFSGTQETPQAGMARVSLEFSRDSGYWPASMSGFETISVARRLYRTGESSYTINDVKCRLKDVADIFMDTGLTRHGYAIIGQGRIKDIIQAKPEDIRYLIEEAADVGRFRLKRTEALRRLEASAQNLERIQDLLGEVSKQRNSLKNQAAKAMRYQELREELNNLTHMLWSHEILQLDAQRKSADEHLVALAETLEQTAGRKQQAGEIVAQLSSACDESRRQIAEFERQQQAEKARLDLTVSQIAAGRARLGDVDAGIAQLEARVAEQAAALDRSRAEIAAASAGSQQLESEQELAEASCEQSLAEQEQQEAVARELDADFERRRSALFEVLGEQRAIEQRRSALVKRRQETDANLSRRTAELESLNQTEVELRQELAEVSTQMARVDEALAGLRASLTEIESMAAQIAGAAEDASASLVAAEKAEAENKAKVAILSRLLGDGAAGDVDCGPRLRGRVKPKAGFEEAVGRALGAALDYALVENHSEIESRAGAPGFIPQQAFVAEPVALNGAGLIAPLADCLDGADDAAVMAVVQNHWLVEDLAAASLIWREQQPGVSLITLDGFVLEPSGVVRNTSARHGEMLKAAAEHAELAARSETLAAAVVQARAVVAEQRERLKTCRERQQSLVAGQREEERQQQRLASKLTELQGRLERLEQRRRGFESEIGAWSELKARLEQEEHESLGDNTALLEAIETRQQELRAQEQRRAGYREQLEQARKQAQTDAARLNEVKIRLAALKARQRGLEEDVIRRTAEIAADRSRAAELAGTGAEIGAQLAELEAVQVQVAEQIQAIVGAKAGLAPEAENLAARLQAQEAEVEELGRQHAELERQRGQLLLKVKEYEIAQTMRLERLQARFECGPVTPEAGFDVEKAKTRAAETQTVIEGLGQINFTSIEAHEEAQNRYEEIHRQYEDLVQATAKLKEVIAGCERESNKAFMATFVKVRSNFQEIFATMFDGGNADLVLEDGDEAGVEIFACPPHKKPKTMSLLSEGEKTLCALSFIFALFKVKPSPFCVMDEVDAPLDDANVERMLRLIRGFAGETQFLVVTHNRRTMEMADIIYGVTFDVPGITKVISMNLQDADERAA